jgi:hypothetical protein
MKTAEREINRANYAFSILRNSGFIKEAPKEAIDQESLSEEQKIQGGAG